MERERKCSVFTPRSQLRPTGRSHFFQTILRYEYESPPLPSGPHFRLPRAKRTPEEFDTQRAFGNHKSPVRFHLIGGSFQSIRPNEFNKLIRLFNQPGGGVAAHHWNSMSAGGPVAKICSSLERAGENRFDRACPPVLCL